MVSVAERPALDKLFSKITTLAASLGFGTKKLLLEFYNTFVKTRLTEEKICAICIYSCRTVKLSHKISVQVTSSTKSLLLSIR